MVKRASTGYALLEELGCTAILYLVPLVLQSRGSWLVNLR